MRRSTGLAVLLAALALAEAVIALASVLLPPRPGIAGPNVTPLEVILTVPFIFGTPVIGALVAARRPHNPTGWLLLLFVLGLGLSIATDGLVRHVRPDALLTWITVLASSFSSVSFGALFLLLAYFPTGRLPSPRWRVLPILAVAATVGVTIVTLFQPGSPVSPPVADVTNPLGRPDWLPVLNVANAIALQLFSVVALGSAALLVVRFRRSRGSERQQLKWFAGGAIVPAGLLAALGAAQILGLPALGDLLWAAAISSFFLMPAGVAVAILRYRLFDIDRIIRRTLVYAGVSLLLAATYGLSVLVLSQILSSLAARSSIVVAASTLAAAAAFQPARRRIQAIVDRRFDRSGYDAATEIQSFGVRVRDEVEFAPLAAALTATPGADHEAAGGLNLAAPSRGALSGTRSS
ncbi:MAG TPA: hypothetical protein VIM30_09735 [Candidatus Limnocylindrales bacterium]|jgi:hypothetical protein